MDLQELEDALKKIIDSASNLMAKSNDEVSKGVAESLSHLGNIWYDNVIQNRAIADKSTPES